MLMSTKRFGDVEIDRDKVIKFLECIPGFESSKRYILIKVIDTLPFYWLQSVDEQELSFPVINPFEVMDDYSPQIDNSLFERLHLSKDEELLVVNVAVLTPDIRMSTVNLAAPILINIAKNIGIQAIINSGEYMIRQPVFKASYQKTKGDHSDAGADSQDK